MNEGKPHSGDDARYFASYRLRPRPLIQPMSKGATVLWQMLAGATIGLGLWYLHWRWTASLNPEALAFSIVVASAETMAFLGTALFFFDIWSEGDTPAQTPPGKREEAGLDGEGSIHVDILITTYDEGTDVVGATLADARLVRHPPGVTARTIVLDDGQQDGMRALAFSHGAEYLTREGNHGFKAGNLRNALLQTRGDFVVICDADTRLFPGFLENTLGYFRDSKVAWVQTPHWFYDIPEGRRLAVSRRRPRSRFGRALAAARYRVLSKARIGKDPFLSDPVIFFDVILRRRNRHSASFCCGAGSIHRREAVFDNALLRCAEDLRSLQSPDRRFETLRHLRTTVLQPFCFHVSEDILTSINQHAAGWRSVYHPQVEARMLSPWSIKAWATQRLKYAGGTFDIMLHHFPFFRGAMPLATRLHYLATFWSYLSILWLPILFLAPAFSLFSARAPVDAYSTEFFLHLLPLLLLNEAALFVGCKGYDSHAGRVLANCAIPIQVRAAFQVLRGQRPSFPTTPKKPGQTRDWSYARPALVLLAVMIASLLWGSIATFTGVEDYSASLLTVNAFWIGWNAMALLRVIRMCLWLPPRTRRPDRRSGPSSILTEFGHVEHA